MKTSYNSILRPGKGGGATLLFVLLLLSGVFVLSAVNKPAGKFYFYATITVDDDGPADHTSIQAAIDAAEAGDVIEVADGNYEESINLNKAVTIKGANADIAAGASPGTRIAETTINGGFIVSAAATLNGLKIINGRSSGSVKVGVAVASSNVTILNCIIEDVGLSVRQSDGISTQPGNNALTLTNSTIKNNWRGIYLNPGGGHTFTGNLVDANNGVGVGIGSDGQSNFTLTGNVISNNTLEGWGSSTVGVNVLAKNNQFLNNGVSIAHYGGSQINANLNYWGADAPAAGVVSGDVNIDSWWKDAAYTMLGTVQPVVNVTQNTVFATIQAAINAAAAGDVIQVAAGTYDESITINKAGITILGPNSNVAGHADGRSAEAEITGAAANNARFKVTAENVTIDGLKIAISAGSTTPPIDVTANGTTLKNCIINSALYQKASALTFENNLVANLNTTSGYAGNAISSDKSGIFENWTIKGNVFDGTQRGLSLASVGTTYKNLKVEGNTFKNIALRCIQFGDNGMIDGAEIKDNIFKDSQSGLGIFNPVSQVSNLVITGNSMEQLQIGFWINTPAGANIFINQDENSFTNVDQHVRYQSPISSLNMTEIFGEPLSFQDVSVEFFEATELSSAHYKISKGSTTITVVGIGKLSFQDQNVHVVGPGGYATIQEAIDAASAGDEIQVAEGTYNENVIVNKNVSLIGAGSSSTIIDGVQGGNELGAIVLASGSTNVTIKDFHVKGIDGSPGIEKAAIYLQGTQSNITIEGNIIEARGDAALMGEYNANNDNIIISGNNFIGQTFNGSTPSTGDQFTVENVARQAIVFGGGVSTSNTKNFTFTYNTVNTAAGASGIGNTLVTLDLVGSLNTITYNSFLGYSPANGLRVRGSGYHDLYFNDLSGPYPVAIFRQGAEIDAPCNWYGASSGIAASKFVGQINIFPYLTTSDLGNPSCNGEGPVQNITQDQGYFTIQAAIDAASSGDEIQVSAGTYDGDVILNKDVVLKGANQGVCYSDTRKSESTIQGKVTVSAAGATLDGFQLTKRSNSTTANNINFSNWDGSSLEVVSANTTISNNIIEMYGGAGGTTNAVTLNAAGVVTFECNEVRAGNEYNAQNDGRGVSALRLTNTSSDYTISGNRFGVSSGRDSGGDADAVSLFNVGNVNFDGNLVNGNIMGGVVLFGSVGEVSIINNTIEDYTAALGGIRLVGCCGYDSANAEVTISNNLIRGSQGTTGIQIINAGIDIPASDIVELKNNSITGNEKPIVFTGTGTLDATCNWWGSATAAISSSIPAGVTYVPFLSGGTDNSANNGFQNTSPCSGTFSDWCSDGIQSGNETGIDCGGDCIACPTCNDGIQNQGEIGVDCGGPCGICDLPVFVNAPADATISYAEATTANFSALSYSNGQTGGCAITGTVQPIVLRSFGTCGGTITATWNFIDKCNRTVTHVQTVTVLGIPQADWVNPPAAVTISCREFLDSYRTPVLAYSNGLTGNNQISGQVQGQREVVADACGAGFTETWSYTDFCGRNITHTRFVSVTATCDDGIQNQGEIGVDCGGPNCAACPPCERPSGLYVNAISGSNATFNWNKVDNVLVYAFQIRRGGSQNWISLPATTNKITLGGLFAGETYEWRVLADCEKLDSDWSAMCAFVANDPSSGNCDNPENGPTCVDGIQNQGEGGIDCGGPCATACPTCDDGIQNQGEEGIDCGGPCAECPPEVCEAPTGLEALIDPSRGRIAVLVWEAVPNARGYEFSYRLAGNTNWITLPQLSENTATLGGLTQGQAYEYRVKTICSKTESDYSLTCNFIAGQEGSGSCEPLMPTCEDGLQNQGEEGIDCGGPCAPCPTCEDGLQNQGEEGIDCGGPCTPCPTCEDGIQNQGEDGIDCGGPCAPCPPPACDAPTGLQATTFGRSAAATVDWEAATNAESYLLSWRSVGATRWNEIVVTGNSYRFTNLVIGNSYEWRVLSSCGTYLGAPLRSPWSAICSFTTGVFNVGCAIIEPTCEDGIRNQGETGVDCGGPCAPCPTCDDDIRNQGEEGVDCGGPCTPCPTCDDGIQNGDETGVDCGGENCAPCETCDDDIQNQGEDGIDCGGPCAPCECPAPTTIEVIIFRGAAPDSLYWEPVPNTVGYQVEWRTVGSETWNELFVTENGVPGRLLDLVDDQPYEWRVRSICEFVSDFNFYSTICFFTSNVPGSAFCDEESTCDDGIQNQGEEGIDCGGPCIPCATCEDGVQNGDEEGIDCGGDCEPCATCEDGVQNGDEEGIDCGGTACTPCESCSDGIQNQGEEGIDCGGPCAACPECETPTELNFERFGKFNMRLFWNPVADATRYQVRLRILDTEDWRVSTVSGSPFTASRLTLGAIYEWQVKTICGELNLESEWSEVQYFMAGEAGEIVPGGLTELNTETELLRVFPVPTANLLNVTLNNEGIAGVKLSMMDMTGNTVLVMPVEQGTRSVQLNVSDLPRGIYFIKAEHETAVKVLRVVLQ